MSIGHFIVLMITFLPGLLALILGIAPGLAGNAIAIEAMWVRVLFIVAGTLTTLLSLRAIAKKLLGVKNDDAETRVKRAPFIGVVFVGSAALLFAVVLAGDNGLSGEGGEPLRVVFGLYAAWLTLFGLPTLFARKLEKIQPPTPAAPAAPTSCPRCGVALSAGSSVCTYCGTQLA